MEPARQADCARFEELLPELIGLDGEGSALPAEGRDEILRHAASCARCADARRAYTATVDLLRALPRKNAPPDFLSWVRSDLAGAASRALRFPRGRARWLALAAVVPLAAGAALFIAATVDRPAVPEVAMAPRGAQSPSQSGTESRAPRRTRPEMAPAEARLADEADPARVAEWKEERLVRQAPGSSAPEQESLEAGAPMPDGARPASERDASMEKVLVALPFVPGSWERDCARLEGELVGRFAEPSRGAGPRAPASVAQSDTRAARGVGGRPEATRRGRVQAPAVEDSSALSARADAEAPLVAKEAAAAEGAAAASRAARDAREAPASPAPRAREITLSMDPARIPELRAFLDGWSGSEAQASRPLDLQKLQEKLEGPPRPPVQVRIVIQPAPPPSGSTR